MPAPRLEYPRPHFDRSHSWLPLNGEWDFAPAPALDGETRGLSRDTQPWDHTITVPFAWETPASGVGLHWLEAGWYRRMVEADPSWGGQRGVPPFGAAP